MSLDNVQLWFARDRDNKIVTINEVDKENKDKYYCPLCNSEVIPRQGEINSWCFAHIDKSKCSSESMYHFWVKNKLLQKGDKFKIQTDKEKEYICDEILVEETYKIGDKEYRPDLTVKTTEGDIIYFEMNYSNEKKLEDYLDIWIELGKVVVEVDVKTLINSESGKLPVFKAKYYNGKCFNVKKGEDRIYHDTIGQYKERLIKNNEYNDKKKEIQKLDWLWKEFQNYKIGISTIEEITTCIDNIKDEEINIVADILKKPKICNNVLNDYIKHKKCIFNKILESYIPIFKNMGIELIFNVEKPRIILDRLKYGLLVDIRCKWQRESEIDEYIKTKDELKNKIEKLYINKTIINNVKPVVDVINNKFNYIDEKININLEKIDLYEHDDVWLEIYDEEFNLSKIDICNFSSRYKIYKLIIQLMNKKNIKFPINKNKLKDISSMIENVKDICEENWESELKKHKWIIHSTLYYNQLKINLNAKLNNKTKEYSSVILDFLQNKITYFNKNTIDLEENFDLSNLDVIKEKVIKYFNNTKENNKIINNEIFIALNKIKTKYNAIENFNVMYSCNSPTKLNVTIEYDEDCYKFYILNNKFYKRDIEIYDFNKENEGFIFNIFSKIIDRQFYINTDYIKSDVINLIENLTDIYSNVIGDYEINYKVNSEYIIELKNNYRKISSIVLKNHSFLKENLKNEIINQFSNSIRKDKYGDI